WNSRGHFFAAAAEAMRRLLVENARRKKRRKHGGALRRVELHEAISMDDAASDEFLALNDALDRLAVANPLAARLVELRYFAGLANADAASLLSISPRKANQIWAYARCWLLEELSKDEKTGSSG